MAKKKQDTRKPKQKSNKKPRPNTNKIIKSGDTNELKAELERINELSRRRPLKDTKNKQKRQELVLMRNGMKNKIKAKLRRKKQKIKEELGDDHPDLQEEKKPHTLETLRDKDDTMVNLEEDEELKQAIDNDEYTGYFNKEYDPQILITTSIKHTGAIFKFVRELKETIPNSYFYYRKKFDLGHITKEAIERGFTDIIIVTERLRKPYRMILMHLPDGPTVEFKIFNVAYQEQIDNHGRSSGHNPELIFKNFNTRLGSRLSRILHGLFPVNPALEGRQVITFHNQRDYIFFRFHRYIFNEEFNKVTLQEIGPRFCLRLLSIQKGTFDNQFGEYEWFYKNKMGVRRRKFYL